MTKNVLIIKFNSCKRSILIVLFSIVICLDAFAQNRQITGKVTSSDNGEPLTGVSVRVKGTPSGTTTDVSGSFKISVSADATLVFGYIGYVSQEVAVVGNSIIDVKLVPDINTLHEVEVVAIGYGTTARKDLSGAISSVSAATIAKVPVTTLDQALQGRMAGVQVTNNDASPGGNVTILVRGVGSLANNGNGPLYVVDGFPLDNGGINNINPNDIASIDVLKDASATAIYGIRAANGVVLVTTKKGKKDGVQVSFDMYDAFQSKPKEYSVLGSTDFATLYNTIAADPLQTVHLPTFATYTNPSALHNVDWQNVVYRPGLTQSYSLAIRGGSNKVQASTSVGYYDQKGIVIGSYFKRVTLGNNTDYQPVKWFKSSTSIKYTWQDQQNPLGGQLQNGGSLIQVTELPPTLDGGNLLTSEVKDANGNYGFFNPKLTQISSYGNPLYNVQTQRSSGMSNFLLGNTSFEATIIDGLKIKSNGGVNISTFSGSFFSPEDDRASVQYPGSQIQNAFYSQHINQTFDWLWENTLSYDKTFGKHTINFLAGASEQKTFWTGMGGQGIPPNGIIRDLAQVSNLKLDTNNPPGSNSGNGENIYALQSYFGRLTYKYDDKYILTGTVRRDGSSKFDPSNYYGTFPSGAVAWKAKDEAFLKNVSWLSDLKLRGSYGEVGNQGPILPFQSEELFSTGFGASVNGGGVDNLGYPFNKLYQNGTAQTQPANIKLKWETDYQTDIGMDASFLNGDLTVTADWFNRRSKDFLISLAVPAQTGFNFLTKNIGSMDNKGLEFAINYNHRVSGDFQYGINLTLSTVDNKLTSITSGANFVTNFGGLTVPADGWGTFSETNIGQPVGEFFGYKSLGIIQSQAQLDALNESAAAKHGAGSFYQKNITKPGDRLFADINGDGIVDANDQISLGSPLPKFYGGVDFTASYKSFDFNAYFYGVYGNKIFNFQESALESFQNRSFVGVENVSQQYYNSYWTPARPSNTFARATANDDVEGSNVASSAYIENGSFLKLKNFTIGYTLPAEIAKTISVTKIRLYFSTQNLFTITSYKGLDPEIGLQGGNATQNGIDTGTYPSTKFYTVGLNVTF
jgi:TonB-dependent starch-binding outer membrane protein SusC